MERGEQNLCLTRDKKPNGLNTLACSLPRDDPEIIIIFLFRFRNAVTHFIIRPRARILSPILAGIDLINYRNGAN